MPSIFNPTRGSWSVFGQPLPDFGITEALGLNRGSQVSQTFLDPSGTPQSTQQSLSGGSVLGAQAPNHTPAQPSDFQNQPQTRLSDPTPRTGGGGGQVRPPVATEDPNFNDTLKQEQQAIHSLSDADIGRLEADSAAAGSSRDQLLSQVSREQQNLQSRVDTQKQQAADKAADEISEGADSARKTQQGIRNMLRAMGILASSAAGELLSRPLTKFDQQKAKINASLKSRIRELEDYFNDATLQLSQEKTRIKSQYEQMINNIRADIRFTEAERESSLVEAQKAFNERMLEIKQAFTGVQSQVAQGATELANFVFPELDTQSIAQTANLSDPNQSQTSKTASIVQPEDDDEILNRLFAQ